MLGSADIIAFVPTRDPDRARRFYQDVLGLELVTADRFALVFNAHGVMVRIANVSQVKDFRPAPFTILGWQVASTESTVRDLSAKGVSFERFPGMDQSPLGIWRSPSGADVAWFKDPDGNVLSLTSG
jgi:catechol 2,3-dioxygenase-like lactoylglutathione lyase family enzyme